MAQRKAFLLRLPPDVLEQIERWAKDDLRSVNAQIEFLLRDALAQRGIAPVRNPATKPDDGGEDE